MLPFRTNVWLRSWQVKLVLVLIACLGAVGLVLVRQDRRMVEQEAQLHAQDLAEALARHCRASLNNTLESFVAAAEDARRAVARQAEGKLDVLLADQQPQQS